MTQVDMDEDEKEMLSEARARLANTQGKKAKRKAREKQLEEARRLASLQKRRELKAAGIDVRTRKRRSGFMDYNAEIPFEKRPAVGFYDPAADDAYAASNQFVKRSLQQLEPERRMDKEMEERKKDAKRQRIAKEKNLPSVIAEINAMNDPDSTHRRLKLSMPAPQITDEELTEVARLGKPAGGLEGLADAEDGTATSTLLADYSTAVAPTPMAGRTPMRTPAAHQDVVLAESQNLLALTHGQTPLAGEENAELHPTDFSGITPQRRVEATPNPIATPGGAGSVRGGSVRGGSVRGGSVRGGGGLTPGRTPLRDELRINDEGASEEQLQEQLLRAQVASGLTGLPAPKNEYHIQVPDATGLEDDDDEGGGAGALEEDASDRKKRLAAEKAAAAAARLRTMSQPLQRQLRRPSHKQLKVADAPQKGASAVEQAAALIEREIGAIVTYEALAYPPKGGKPKKKDKLPPRDEFSPKQMESAALLLLEEMQEESRPLPDAAAFAAVRDRPPSLAPLVLTVFSSALLYGSPHSLAPPSAPTVERSGVYLPVAMDRLPDGCLPSCRRGTRPRRSWMRRARGLSASTWACCRSGSTACVSAGGSCSSAPRRRPRRPR
jgi:pre-mRNA-splicing factor CDC5/CEF1